MTEAPATPRQRLARTLGRRGLLAALITAGGIFALLLAQNLIQSALRSFGSFDLGSVWIFLLQQSLASDLPFTIGVFLSLWQILPIAPELRFAHVVTRSLFAALIGAVAVAVVTIVIALVTVAVSFGFGDLGRSASEATSALITQLGRALQQAITAWVYLVPIVVLAGLLLWGWTQRFPPRHPVAGALDEL